MSKLVIVESPAKCKKIEEYLGTGYKCMATYGHFRELRDLTQISSAYVPRYVESDIPTKKRQIYKLREAIKEASEVIIATDDDREGEDIGWHCCDLFHLPVETTKRIIFHEITRQAVEEAIKNPGRLNMNMVAAAHARQILDLIVGFKVTPTLWKHFSAASKENPLSAGRCQTPALRLVFDNDLATRVAGDDAAAATTTGSTNDTYKVVAYFTQRLLPFELTPNITGGQTAIEQFLTASTSTEHRFMGCEELLGGEQYPPKPLTTSLLQQEANRELNMTVKTTMQTAQSLYERGVITYMRTDKPEYSPHFVDLARSYIENRWGASYVCSQTVSGITVFSATASKTSKRGQKGGSQGGSQGATTAAKVQQGAHEAIRPTNVEYTPEDFNAKCENAIERRLYRLIWEHAVATCMSPAIIDKLTARISSAVEAKVFQYKCDYDRFPGWKLVKSCAKTQRPQEWDFLKTAIKHDAILQFKRMRAEPVLRTGPQHHTEAHLVQLLEEMGIGRPSTFAMLVDKIQERDYVKIGDIAPHKVTCRVYMLDAGASAPTVETVQREVGAERRKLLLQPIGRIVSDFLWRHFADLINYQYTSQMEAALDDIAHGRRTVAAVCAECDALVERCLSALKGVMGAATAAAEGGKRVSVKLNYKFDVANTLVINREGPVVIYKSGRGQQTRSGTYNIPLRQYYLDRFDMTMFDRICRGEIKLTDLCDITASVAVAGDDDDAVSTAMPSTASMQTKELGAYGDKVIVVRNGKYGHYASVEAPLPGLVNPKGKSKGATVAAAVAVEKKEKQTVSLRGLGEHRTIASYTLEEVVDLLEGRTITTNPNILREVSANISIRKGKAPKFAPYIYFKSTDMVAPTFYKLKGFLADPLSCPIDELRSWIKDKYKVF